MTQDVPSRRAALDFERDIERLTTDFTGREWILADVDRWLKRDGQRFFILTGQPGVGKSAIAARLTQVCADIAAFHFCIAGRNDTIVPASVLRSLAAQLENVCQAMAWRSPTPSTRLSKSTLMSTP